MEQPPRRTRSRGIVECFEGLPDPRVDRTRRHKLIDILVIGLCSMLTLGEGFTDMEFLGRAQFDWFKTFLELPNGVPSHDTFNRVFSAIDPHRFLECFVDWVQGVCTALAREVVAIDGKALRRAADAGATLPYIVSAWASENGLALGQVRVDDKSNEITAIPELLRALALSGCIVTIDAMGCQKEIAALVADKGADYVLALKGNQGIAHGEFKEYFDHAAPPGTTGARLGRVAQPGTVSFFQSVEKAHGRLETRRYWQTTDIAWFHDRKRWKALASVGMVESRRTAQGTRAVERRYYLSSLPLGAQTFAKAVRGHWGVENPLHWSLDVTFREDQSRARTRHAAQNLATLRRLALNLLKNDRTRNLPVRRKRMLAAVDHDYLKRLLGV
jgi:predicted transposase YbfD/YdcC